MKQLYDIYKAHPVICTDTRKIVPSSIFFALTGANFNGNLFAAQALEEGCAYAVVSEIPDSLIPFKDRIMEVEDTLVALQQLANYHRQQLNIPIIGLTGSNGKTTTKELIKCVLSSHFNTYATKGNLNNHIGVPLSLLEINETHDIAVIEMGANHQGEIQELSEISDPDLGMITNVGKAHLEGFGGFEGVKKGKSEIYRHLHNKQGVIVVNNDDPLLLDLIPSQHNLVTYGTDADIKGTYIASDPFIRFSWSKEGYESGELQTQLIGKYNYYNILAALAIGHYYNVPPEKASQAICNYVSDNNRSQVIRGRNTIILDAYNANPSSMGAALSNFSNMPGDKLCILGDMLELGEDGQKEHENIIEQLKTLQLDAFLVGPLFHESNHSDYKSFEDRHALSEHISDPLLEGKLILIKGSRGIRLEEVVELAKLK